MTVGGAVAGLIEDELATDVALGVALADGNAGAPGAPAGARGVVPATDQVPGFHADVVQLGELHVPEL